MRRWRQPLVCVEAKVAIPPVQRPAPGRLRVAEPGNGKPCPLRADVLVPRRPALDDRQMPGPDIALHPDLVADMLGNALIAPAPDSRYVQFRQPCLRHWSSLSRGDVPNEVLLPPVVLLTRAGTVTARWLLY
jgi:hypothetical protein